MTVSHAGPGTLRPAGIARALGLALIVSAPMFYQLGRWPLLDPDEGRNAEVAREMLELGSWAVPRFNDLPFLDKPPLLFWSIAAAFRGLGITEVAARLPSALAGLAVVLLTMAAARMLLDRRTAFWAAAVVATSPLVLVYARLTIFDMPFTAFVTLALVCLLRRRLGGRADVWLPMAGVAIGLAVLTKGPVGIALPLLAWAAARGALPPAPPTGRRPVLLACLVCLAIVAPWLIMVARDEPAFLRYAIVDETVLRFTSTARFHRGEPFYYPLFVSGIGMGIWSAVLIGTAPLLFRGTGATDRQRIALRFAARAAAAIILFFSVSASKRAGYVLPAFVPLGLLVAVAITMASQRAAAAVRVAAIVAVGVAIVFAAIEWDPMAMASLSQGDGSGALTSSLLVVVGAICLVWGALVFGARRRWALAPVALAAAFGPGLYLGVQGPLMPFAEGRSAKQLASQVPAGATIVSFRHFRPSLPFYLGRPVQLATADGHELTSNYVSSQLQRFLNDGRLMTPASARSAIRDTSMVYVLTGASWTASLPRFRATPLTFVARDRRSALWLARD
ncbi:MAG TPA: glycosyltransferase family 39 protein [Candidatus Binatia bacterium]|jgi:4-amino-4-deoxy-L-arabinose transferase-like glycosyltransferase|nr:glycosyltransferase family 39 protein [Candidatus Binatia bacterium]